MWSSFTQTIRSLYHIVLFQNIWPRFSEYVTAKHPALERGMESEASSLEVELLVHISIYQLLREEESVFCKCSSLLVNHALRGATLSRLFEQQRLTLISREIQSWEERERDRRREYENVQNILCKILKEPMNNLNDQSL